MIINASNSPINYIRVYFQLFFKDFAARSLKIVQDNDTDADVLSRYEVKKGREWDERLQCIHNHSFHSIYILEWQLHP